MTKIKNISLQQFKKLLNLHDLSIISGIISQNLAVAKDVQVSILKNEFTNDPILLPEMRILLLKRGHANVTINLVNHDLHEGDLLFLAAGGIIQFGDISEDMRGMGIAMNDELFKLALGNEIPMVFDGSLRNFHLHLNDDQLHYYTNLHNLLYLNQKDENKSPQVTLHLISTILWYLNNIWSQHNNTEQNQSREHLFFSRFLQLVNEHAQEHHEIGFYASILCLSPRYMSNVIHSISGKSAKYWIDNALITRAKVLLRFSDKQIIQISEDMNFANPAFFCKFFRRLTGFSPLEYRKKLK